MEWLSVKKVSDLLGYTERAIRTKAINNEFTYHYTSSSTGQGGRKIEILLESLPEQAQKAYHNQEGKNEAVINTDFAFATKAQREKGELRAAAIAELRKYTKEAKKNGLTKKMDIMKSFVTRWNTENPEFQITIKSLYDWKKKTKTGNVDKLVDQRGGYNRGTSSIPQQYQEYFLNIYLQQSKPSIETCFIETQLKANINGNVIPGIKAFRLLVKNTDKALLIKRREGQKVFDDTCMPYTERDFSKISPNEWWVSDHHLWDIFVRIPDDNGGWKLARPWGSYWMDMRTRKMMSSIIRVDEPNSDIVLCSFGLGVEHFGVPEGVRLDNGKDYKAKDLFSQDDNKRIADSLAKNLQVDVTYAIPYNAKAKPIERTFNTYENQLAKMYPSYAGRNAKERPEELKDINIMDVITLEEFIAHHNKYVYEIYNNASHNGDSMFNKSPNHLYSTLEFKLRTTSKNALYFSLMRVKGTRVIGRNGITFNGIHFYNDSCISYIDQKIIAKYDPTKPEILYVFDINENFLFVATQVEKQGWELTKEDYQKENHRKKIARQKALNSYTSDNTIRSTESIGERLEMISESMEHSPIASPKVIEVIRNPKIEKALERINLSDLERSYEDALNRQRAEKKTISDKQQQLEDRFKKKMLDISYRNQAQ